jgi:hypothetical protein
VHLTFSPTQIDSGRYQTSFKAIEFPSSKFNNTKPRERGKRPFVPQEFLYDLDFDNQGALYYLGTLGFQTAWQNPEARK